MKIDIINESGTRSVFEVNEKGKYINEYKKFRQNGSIISIKDFSGLREYKVRIWGENGENTFNQKH